MSERWHRVGTMAEIVARTVRRVRVGRVWAALHVYGTAVYAIQDECPHRGATLSNGCVTADGFVECPEHGWEFRLATGEGREEWEGCIARFDVRVDAGEVFVKEPEPPTLLVPYPGMPRDEPDDA